MTCRIMIIEDDAEIAGLLSAHLQKHGYEAYCCSDFKDIVAEFQKVQPDLILLDINLPMFDGFYWCRKLRESTSCPIIFLSSRSGDTDQVYAMMNGGDDFVTKPFSMEVLIAKIAAVLRRAYGEYASGGQDALICGDCSFSMQRMTLTCGKQTADLSKTEAGVLRLLFSRYPKISTREELLNEIWDSESFVEENTLNVTVSRIRKRLMSIQSELEICSVRGLGYRIRSNEDEA